MATCCEKHARSQTPAIEAAGLYVNLEGRPVLEDISLQILQGEAVALIGPNGAGKTTLLRALLGLLPAKSGSVRILGCDAFREVSQRVGYVPQRLVADPSFALSVREFLSLHLKGIRWPWFSKRRVDQLLAATVEEIGIQDLLGRSVAELSGGQFQRVMIAFALLKEPEVLFMDEPTAGVDAPGEESFYEMIGKIHTQRHLKVLLVSHDLSMVYKHASRVYALNRSICCQGTPREVLAGQSLAQLYGRELSYYQHHHGDEEKHQHQGSSGSAVLKMKD